MRALASHASAFKATDFVRLAESVVGEAAARPLATRRTPDGVEGETGGTDGEGGGKDTVDSCGGGVVGECGGVDGGEGGREGGGSPGG
jgi:hypothetical protein